MRQALLKVALYTLLSRHEGLLEANVIVWLAAVHECLVRIDVCSGVLRTESTIVQVQRSGECTLIAAGVLERLSSIHFAVATRPASNSRCFVPALLIMRTTSSSRSHLLQEAALPVKLQQARPRLLLPHRRRHRLLDLVLSNLQILQLDDFLQLLYLNVFLNIVLSLLLELLLQLSHSGLQPLHHLDNITRTPLSRDLSGPRLAHLWPHRVRQSLLLAVIEAGHQRRWSRPRLLVRLAI